MFDHVDLPDPTPKAIRMAKELTPAQRRAMSNVRFSRISGKLFIPFKTRWDVRTALFRKGLLGSSAALSTPPIQNESHRHE